MWSTRLLFLFGVVLLVGAKSILPAEEDWEIDFISDIIDNLDEETSRVRRDVDDEKETRDRENSSEYGPPPVGPGGSGGPGDCECPPPPPPHPRAGHRRPPPSCEGLTKEACIQKMTPPPYDGPPCELRTLFRLPMDFNQTARKECFDRWERSALEEKGFDFNKPPAKLFVRPQFQRTLMVHKGCDTQCMFLENKMIDDGGDSLMISKDAVLAALKEEEDPEEISEVLEAQVKKCLEEASELIHAKQSCKSGADEFLACVRLNVSNACPGAKWKGNRSCAEIEKANTKLRDCRREKMATFLGRFRSGMKSFPMF